MTFLAFGLVEVRGLFIHSEMAYQVVTTGSYTEGGNLGRKSKIAQDAPGSKTTAFQLSTGMGQSPSHFMGLGMWLLSHSLSDLPIYAPLKCHMC